MSVAIASPAALRAGRRMGAETSPSIAYWFATPSLVLLFGTMLLPIALMIVMSFTDYELGVVDFKFVGLANYLTIWNDGAVWRSLLNTLYYVALVVPSSVILGLLLAVMVSGLKRGRVFYQVAFFLPVTSTLVSMAAVWKYLLHGTIGPVNHLLAFLGLPAFEFFGDPNLVMPALAIIGVWALAGFNMVLFTAGLTAIPEELYEAASVDGIGNPIERFFTVTLPMLGPTTMFVIVTSSITAFKVFDTVAVLTRGGPQGASNVLLYINYLEGFQYMRIGVAAAITVVFLAIILLLSLVQARVLERRVHY